MTNYLGPWVAFTLYITAARYDANPSQLTALRSQVVPAIQDLKRRDVTAEEIRRLLAIVINRVQGIMGPQWRPTGEWMEAIDALLGKEKTDTASPPRLPQPRRRVGLRRPEDPK